MTTSESSRAALGMPMSDDSQPEEQKGSTLVVGGLPAARSQKAKVSAPKLKILVVDDSNTYRKQLCSWLEMEDFEVVGEAATGWEALELHQEFAPDVVLMDQNMPSLTGVDATRRIKADHPDTRIIFIAAEETWRSEAFRAGADGYFVKGDDMSRLMTAIQHPAGVWEKPAGWPKPQRGRRIWFWPLVGGLVVLATISLFVAFPSIVALLLGLLTGLTSLIAGLK